MKQIALVIIFVAVLFEASFALDCPKCKVEMTEKANSYVCPKCGATVEITHTEIFPKAETGAEAKHKLICAVAVARTYITHICLKAPATAKFDDEGMIKNAKKIDSNTFEIRSFVDSQNSFGALIRTQFLIKLQNVSGTGETFSDWKIIEFIHDP
jgi:transcription initiation factor TFIIIB Brf1 subunit/transcription initiation factor TFIIB